MVAKFNLNSGTGLDIHCPLNRSGWCRIQEAQKDRRPALAPLWLERTKARICLAVSVCKYVMSKCVHAYQKKRRRKRASSWQRTRLWERKGSRKYPEIPTTAGRTKASQKHVLCGFYFRNCPMFNLHVTALLCRWCAKLEVLHPQMDPDHIV